MKMHIMPGKPATAICPLASAVLRSIWVALILGVFLAADILAAENAVITVQAGPQQIFRGLGAGQSLGDGDSYTALPDSVRDTLARFLWSDCNFRFIRLRSTIRFCDDTASYCDSSAIRNYRLFVSDAARYQANLVILFSPQDYFAGNVKAYAHGYALQMRALRDSGIAVHFTGIANEPDAGQSYLTAQTAAELVKQFRSQLDSLGLQDIAIIAPETSSADDYARQYVDSILADSIARQSLYAFATHSYNWSITDEMADLTRPYVMGQQKEYWMTEASEFGTEQWADAHQAASVLSRLFADLNHQCNVWMFFVGIKGVESNWNMAPGLNTAFYMILYRKAEHDYGYLLKCWYFKQISQTIVPGAVMRKATTNLHQLNPTKYWRIEDSTMVYAYGRKAPLYLAAGVNPDGSWGIGVSNYTGTVAPSDIDTVLAPTSYSVSVHIQELADSGDISFAMERCNATAPYIHPEGTAVMHAGNLTIDSLGPFDMVTLRSPAHTVAATRLPPSAPVADGLFVRGNNAQSLLIGFRIPSAPRGRSSSLILSLFDVQGRKVGELWRAAAYEGKGTIMVNIPQALHRSLAPGYYILRLEAGGTQMHSPLVIAK